MSMRYCVFCNIIAGREPAQVLYEDAEVIVFRNVLRWLPMMLLTAPKAHLSQEELWSDASHAGHVAATMGRRYCPGGFRLVSNFGWDALQSQPHAHIHVLGGGAMEALTSRGGDTEPVLERDGFRVIRRRAGWPPVVLLGEPEQDIDQDAFWERIGPLGADMVGLGQRLCPYGFRFASDFGWDALQSQQRGHLFLLGGAELGHYV
jgi:histidine triad (HIT) family protein